jgi:hypothetical protein
VGSGGIDTAQRLQRLFRTEARGIDDSGRRASTVPLSPTMAARSTFRCSWVTKRRFGKGRTVGFRGRKTREPSLGVTLLKHPEKLPRAGG